MRKLLSRPLLWISFATVSLALHLELSWCTRDHTLVARCGASWVVFGSAIIARPIIRMGYRKWYQATRIIDGGHFVQSAEDIEEEQQSAIDARCVQVLGPVVAVLGTILWAYGDLAANQIIRSLLKFWNQY